jgi:hypothetical protein
MLSQAREEKNVKFQQQANERAKLVKLNAQRIVALRMEMDAIKLDISTCLAEDYFGMAQDKLNRLIKMKNRIQQLKRAQSE